MLRIYILTFLILFDCLQALQDNVVRLIFFFLQVNKMECFRCEANLFLRQLYYFDPLVSTEKSKENRNISGEWYIKRQEICDKVRENQLSKKVRWKKDMHHISIK